METAGLARRVQAESSVCNIVVWSRVEGLNERLRRLCDSHGFIFLDLRYQVGNCKDPLDRFGVQ